MAKTLLDGVNEVLRRLNKISGDAGALTSLTDSPRQVWIDTAVQAWNEAIEELYSVSGAGLPNEVAEATITLATGDRDYALASDLLALRWPLQDRTNGQYIRAYPGGYAALIADQPIADNVTGLAQAAAIRPTDGQLYLDAIPNAAENGLVYTYLYDKDVSMASASDAMPFNDGVFRALVPAVAELMAINHKREFSAELFRASMGRAARLLTQQQPRTHYGPVRAGGHLPGVGAPFEDDF